MRSRLAFAVALCTALFYLPAAAFADKVNVDFDHHANFSQYHTYSWKNIRAADQLDQSRIKRAVNEELQKRGWQEVPSGGQVSVMATDNIHNEQEAETYYDGMGGGWGMGWGWGGWGWGSGGGFGDSTTTTNNISVSHLVIDLFDASSKHLLWRGISRGELSNNSEKNRFHLYGDIHYMFRKFPPKTQ